MLTPEQIKVRLDQIEELAEAAPCCQSCDLLIDLLWDVLPDLVRLASGRSEDAGARYGAVVPGRLWTERRG